MEVLTHKTTAAVTLLDVAALLMAELSVVSKESLFRLSHRVGAKLNFSVVVSNAWHHRSDVYSSILSSVQHCTGPYCRYHGGIHDWYDRVGSLRRLDSAIDD